MGHSGLTNLCVLHCGNKPLYHGLEIFDPHEPARIRLATASFTKWEQENDSYYWCQWKCWQGGFAGSDSERVQGPRYVPVERGGREGTLGLRGRAGGLFGQAEFAQSSGRRDLRFCGVFPDSSTRGTGEQYAGRVQGIRCEARGAEFGAGSGRLREIVSGLAPQGGRQTQGDGNELHNPAAQWISAEHCCLQCSEHSGTGRVLRGHGPCEGELCGCW